MQILDIPSNSQKHLPLPLTYYHTFAIHIPCILTYIDLRSRSQIKSKGKGVVIIYGSGRGANKWAEKISVQGNGGGKISVRAFRRGGAKFQCEPSDEEGQNFRASLQTRRGKISVHRDLTLLKHLGITLKIFCHCWRPDHIHNNTTPIPNMPVNGIGHFGMMCNSRHYYHDFQ